MGYGFGNRIAVGRRAITAQAQAEQVIWKVAIFGAGDTSSNGEYIWDGETIVGGQKAYFFGTFSITYSEFDGFWQLNSPTDNLYWSYSLEGGWGISPYAFGGSPVPSSALSYAQNSFISNLSIQSGETEISGSYTRANSTMYTQDGGAYSINFIEDFEGNLNVWVVNGTQPWAYSQDLITWTNSSYEPLDGVQTTSITYSA